MDESQQVPLRLHLEVTAGDLAQALAVDLPPGERVTVKCVRDTVRRRLAEHGVDGCRARYEQACSNKAEEMGRRYERCLTLVGRAFRPAGGHHDQPWGDPLFELDYLTNASAGEPA